MPGRGTSLAHATPAGRRGWLFGWKRCFSFVIKVVLWEYGNLAISSTSYVKLKCFCCLHLLLLFNGSSPVIGTVRPSELPEILVLTWAKSKNDKMPSASSCGTKHVFVCSIHTWWVAYNIWYVNHVCIVYTCICMILMYAYLFFCTCIYN